jgi:precorrin-3B synthase
VADLRRSARLLDAALCADHALAGLPARFLFCLDDRGDLLGRRPDLAAVAVAPDRARLWAGGMAGEVVHLREVPGRLLALARRFLDVRGTGSSACWHVAELAGGGADLGRFRACAAPEPTPPPPLGRLVQDDERVLFHVGLARGLLTPAMLEEVLADSAEEVVVTPWRSVVLPDLEARS